LVLPGLLAAADVAVDTEARAVRIPAAAAEQGKYDVLKGAIEYVLVSKGGKEYETLFITECTPEAIQRALAEAAFEPGAPAQDGKAPEGARAGIFVEYEEAGKTIHRPVDELILLGRTRERLRPRSWVVTGSTRAFDPQAGKDVLQCAVTRNIVGLHYGDPSPLLQNSRSEAWDENIYRADAAALPAPGKPVTLVLVPFRRDVPPGTRRVRVSISGRVQGVGFRAYTEGQAKRLGLEGFVKNLPDGRVEAVIEGISDKVAELLRRLEKGPRAARVKGLELKEETPSGEFEEFRVEY
jgi:acylphosphatase